jgi:hypothetical protein
MVLIRLRTLMVGMPSSWSHPSLHTLFLGVNREEVMMGGNPDGIDKVEDSDGGYAFFMESSIITYLIERRCKLAQVEYKKCSYNRKDIFPIWKENN